MAQDHIFPSLDDCTFLDSVYLSIDGTFQHLGIALRNRAITSYLR